MLCKRREGEEGRENNAACPPPRVCAYSAALESVAGLEALHRDPERRLLPQHPRRDCGPAFRPAFRARDSGAPAAVAAARCTPRVAAAPAAAGYPAVNVFGRLGGERERRLVGAQRVGLGAGSARATERR